MKQRRFESCVTDARPLSLFVRVVEAVRDTVRFELARSKTWGAGMQSRGS